MSMRETVDDDAVTAADGAVRRALSPNEGRENGKTPARSIRGTWWLVMAVFVSFVVALGATTFTFTRVQRDVFTRTTSSFEAKVGTLAELDLELMKAKIPMGSVLYELNRTGDLEHEWRAFNAHASRIEKLFADARAADGNGDDHVAQAEAAWQRVVDGTTAAKDMWGTGEVAAAFAAGDDPFGPTVWAAESEVQAALTEAWLDNVARLRAEADAAQRRQAILEPLLGIVMSAALILSALSAWRLSTRILRPLLLLQASAARIRDGRPTDLTDLPPTAGKEVRELATSMSQMTAALSDSHQQLRDRAKADGLTGLANRRALTELLEAAFPRATEGTLALLLIDIDDFKLVNDSMGHAAGDQLLVAVADRVRTATRNADLVARFGGDEFAVVVRAHDALSTAAVIAERILAALGHAVDLDGTPITVGCSIGVAAGMSEAASPEELIRNADVAMYMAKSQGKHRFNLFDSTMHSAMISRVEIKQDLRRAVALGQLELHYQPIVDLGSDDILGFEALIRWQHPTRGLLGPGEFIDLAEETGDIVAIGGWVVDRACQDLAQYQRLAPKAPPLWMSVNVSSRQVLAGDLVETVQAALSRHDVDPAQLVLEITEQSLMTDTPYAAATLAQLRAAGVRVAIDDFGTGFSSLRYLNELPVDILKIDRSFVSHADETSERDLVLEAIVHLGQGLGLQLIAEGIERPSERDRLQRLGDMAGQGYLIARPMPALAVAQLLHRPTLVSVPAGGPSTSPSDPEWGGGRRYSAPASPNSAPAPLPHLADL